METPKDCDAATEAARAAERLITRMQDKAADALKPDNPDPEQAYQEVLEELETAPEVEQVRRFAGKDPDRFGSH